MVSKKRVIFTGSRRWRHETVVLDALMNLDPNKWIVVHGGARGLDKIVDDNAPELGFEVEVYPAKWDLHGNSAGPVRNRLMLSRPNVELVIAFPDPKRSIGTYDMMDIAEEVGIDVIVVEKP